MSMWLDESEDGISPKLGILRGIGARNMLHEHFMG